MAFGLDLWLGDPALPWSHPVCVVGRLLNALEGLIRHTAAGSGKWEAGILKVSGILVLILLGAGAFGLMLIVCHLPYAGIIFTLYFAWAGLAMGCLLQTGLTVLNAVEEAPIPEARAKLSWLVSRDTSQMARPLMRKTLADTLAENYTDAFLAPFFWLVFTGVPGLWFYKVASTMDSQWGYLTPRWRYLGWAGAKMDDALAFIPARLAPIALWLAYFVSKKIFRISYKGRWPGFKTIATHARIMPSPNSGWPMASCAWLCNGVMAGPAMYFGQLQEKPFMGPANAPPWDRENLKSLLTLVRSGAICGVLLLVLIAYMLHLLMK